MSRPNSTPSWATPAGPSSGWNARSGMGTSATVVPPRPDVREPAQRSPIRTGPAVDHRPPTALCPPARVTRRRRTGAGLGNAKRRCGRSASRHETGLDVHAAPGTATRGHPVEATDDGDRHRRHSCRPGISGLKNRRLIPGQEQPPHASGRQHGQGRCHVLGPLDLHASGDVALRKRPIAALLSASPARASAAPCSGLLQVRHPLARPLRRRRALQVVIEDTR